MANLVIQIHPTRAPNLDIDAVLNLCERLAEKKATINALSTAEGEHDGPYLNVCFDTDDLQELWRHLNEKLLQIKVAGQQLDFSSIVTCEGRNGWDDYLLLHHYDRTLTLDKFD
jgi:hypothetical protein